MPEAKKSLAITFLLPHSGAVPIGGFKVVYEYANYMAKRGHTVSVVHPAISLIDKPLRRLKPRLAARTIRNYLKEKMTGSFKPTSWFNVSPSVRLLVAPSLAAKYIPDGDIVVATAWETAEWVQQYPESKGKKFYLIQHLETWSSPEERVLATWKMPLEKIVIAQWLQRIAEDLGQTAHLIHNGLDFDRFKLVTALDNRDPYSLMLLFHGLEWKGTADGLTAFEIARRQEPKLKLTLFGFDPTPDNLPPGVEYYSNPPQDLLRGLYNQASIFLSASWSEGFSLPPAEALQCGAALVLTDIEGPAAYAVNGQTALLSPIKDPEAMAANILRLVRDPDLRLKIARNGHATIQEFTWERAGSAMEALFLRSLQPWGVPTESEPAHSASHSLLQ